MIDELESLLGKASSSADLAAILLGGATGFGVDAEWDLIHAVNPGSFGLVVAAGALGLKKAFDALQEARSGRNARTKRGAAQCMKAKRVRGALEELCETAAVAIGQEGIDPEIAADLAELHDALEEEIEKLDDLILEIDAGVFDGFEMNYELRLRRDALGSYRRRLNGLTREVPVARLPAI